MYKVIKAGSIEELERTVNNYIISGWLPQGGVSTVQGREDRSGYQWTSSANSGSHTVYVNFMQALYKAPIPKPVKVSKTRVKE